MQIFILTYLLQVYSHEKDWESSNFEDQVYHKPHAGGNYSKDCKECEKNIRGDIAEEDQDVDRLIKQLEELGFTDIYGEKDKFVQKDKTKEQMIDLLNKTGEIKKLICMLLQLQYIQNHYIMFKQF